MTHGRLPSLVAVRCNEPQRVTGQQRNEPAPAAKPIFPPQESGGAIGIGYRDGYERPAKLVPGETYRVRIGGITTANYFPAGHRIRIEIAGSNFPLAEVAVGRAGRVSA